MAQETKSQRSVKTNNFIFVIAARKTTNDEELNAFSSEEMQGRGEETKRLQKAIIR